MRARAGPSPTFSTGLSESGYPGVGRALVDQDAFSHSDTPGRLELNAVVAFAW